MEQGHTVNEQERAAIDTIFHILDDTSRTRASKLAEINEIAAATLRVSMREVEL